MFLHLLQVANNLPAANRPQQIEPANVQGILACTSPLCPLWRSGAVSTTYPAGLPEPSAAKEGLLARGNNNTEQTVPDHINKRSAEDSFVHRRYWSPSVVTGEQ